MGMPCETVKADRPIAVGEINDEVKEAIWCLVPLNNCHGGITKNGSVAGRPRGVALSREYTSAAGVAGQLQPLVRRTSSGAGTGWTGTATLQASRNRGRNERAEAMKQG